MAFTDNMLRPVPIDSEPKRANRWYIEFPTDLGIAEWAVQTASRPSLATSEVEIPFLNTSTWIAGRSVWQTITITFIDPIGPSTSQKVMDWIRQCIEHSTGRMGYAVSYKKTLILKLLDPTGQTVEKWTLEGCFITDTDFGSLDMSSDELMNVSITVRFDRAILNY